MRGTSREVLLISMRRLPPVWLMGLPFTDAAIGAATCTIAAILLATFDSKVARDKRHSIPFSQEET